MARFDIAALSPYAGYSRRAFHGATFKGNLYTERDEGGGEVPLSVGAFDGAQIERLIFLDPTQTSGADGALPHPFQQQIDSTRAMPPESRDKNLRSIAEGARVLQIAMDKGRNREAEQLFHRVEMIARRELNEPAWRPWPRERWKGSIRARISDGYALFSSYGSSIVRPLFTLAAVWLLGAAVYWSFSFALSCPSDSYGNCGWPEARREIVPALSFSAQTTLAPTYPLSVKKRVASDFEEDLLFRKTAKGRVQAAWIGFVAFLQSILSPILLFLTVLAARRYYQLG